MGYRSDVIICIPEAHYNEVLKHPESKIFQYLTDLPEPNKTVWMSPDGVNKWIHLFIDYVKWYDNYDDVKTITEWYSSFPEYQFFRLGEDFEDIEVDNQSNFDDFYYVPHEFVPDF